MRPAADLLHTSRPKDTRTRRLPRTLLLLPAAFALACAGPIQEGRRAAGPADRFEVIQSVLPEAVRVHVLAAGTLARTATAVCLRDDRAHHRSFVLTNAHVVERGDLPADPAFQVLVEGRRGTTVAYGATLVAVGAVPDEDLAVLEIRGADIRPARLAEDEGTRVGEDVVVIGAPFGRELSVSAGLVSSLEWAGEGPARRLDRLKTDAPIGYGTSGGGIFRVRDGRLAAIVEGYRTARVELPIDRMLRPQGAPQAADRSWGFDVPMPGETFAAPAAKIRRFLESHGLAALADPGAGEAIAAASSRG